MLFWIIKSTTVSVSILKNLEIKFMNIASEKNGSVETGDSRRTTVKNINNRPCQHTGDQMIQLKYDHLALWEKSQ